jgi:hypothetical protein
VKTPEQILEEWSDTSKPMKEYPREAVVVGTEGLLRLIHLAQAEERKRCLEILHSACAITECDSYAVVAEEIEKGE